MCHSNALVYLIIYKFCSLLNCVIILGESAEIPAGTVGGRIAQLARSIWRYCVPVNYTMKTVAQTH